MAARTIERPSGKPSAQIWEDWTAAHADMLQKATTPQRVLLEALVRFVATVAGHPIVTRVAAFFVLHAGMGLTPAQVGVAIGRTDRAMRNVQALSAQDLMESIWAELRRHRQPKLRAEHAGPIAKYLVDHRHCTQAEVVAFIARALKIEVDPQTLRRFFKAYGLGVLHPDGGTVERTEKESPFA